MSPHRLALPERAAFQGRGVGYYLIERFTKRIEGSHGVLQHYLQQHTSTLFSIPYRFFERHVVELEKQLRMGDQHGFFQNIKSVQLEETKKVESQCVRDEEGRLLRDKGRIRERWVRFFHS